VTVWRRLRRRDLGRVSLGLLGATLVGCARPWRVLRQAPSNPLVGLAVLAVRPLRFDAMRVGGETESVYVAGLDDEEKKTWAQDKEAMDDRFVEALREEAAEAGLKVVPESETSRYVVRGHVRFIEPGFYAYVAAQPSETRIVVTVTTAEGEVVDEIEVVHQTNATITNAAVSNRVRKDAEMIGKAVGKYLRGRVVPDD